MTINSFVETLEIASDDRLGDWRQDNSQSQTGMRRGPKKGAPGADAIDTNLRAAVNAGALVSFVAGVTEDQKNDVLFSTQLAQRAASAKHDRFADTGAWYELFNDVLGRLGWIGEAAAFTERAKTAGSFTIDKSALDVIMTIATANQLAVLVRTLETLKSLTDKHGAIHVFEMQALSERSGNFQLGAVQRADNGALSMALGGFHFRTRDTRGRALFISWGGEEIDFWTAAQKMTLNDTLYAPHRTKVIERLNKDVANYIAKIEIV
jgi:hypothetical protein